MARNRDIQEPVEIIEDDSGPGLGMDAGLIFGTTVVLLAAIIFVMIALNTHYSAGPLS